MAVGIKIIKMYNFDGHLELPKYRSPNSLVMDVKACLRGPGSQFTILPYDRVVIPTGLCADSPESWALQVQPMYELSMKSRLKIVNAGCIINNREEIKVVVENVGKYNEIICHGDYIAQLICISVGKVEWIEVPFFGNR